MEKKDKRHKISVGFHKSWLSIHYKYFLSAVFLFFQWMWKMMKAILHSTSAANQVTWWHFTICLTITPHLMKWTFMVTHPFICKWQQSIHGFFCVSVYSHWLVDSLHKCLWWATGFLCVCVYCSSLYASVYILFSDCNVILKNCMTFPSRWMFFFSLTNTVLGLTQPYKNKWMPDHLGRDGR